MPKHLHVGVGLLCLAFLGPPAFCQTLQPEVICSARQSASNASVCMDWTLGEPLTRTLSGTGTLLTQGFHQYDEAAICSGSVQVEESPFPAEPSIVAFPNPARDHLNVKLEFQHDFSSTLVMYDLFGRAILSQELAALPAQSQISLAEVPAGTYFLRILSEGKALAPPLKVIKVSP